MKRNSALLSLACCVMLVLFTVHSSFGAQDASPSNASLKQRNVAIKVYGFGFGSGLQPGQNGKANGDGVQLVEESWTGSGFLVKNDGTLVTNYHVARRALRAQAVFDDGSAYQIPYIRVYDNFADIAVLKIRANKKFPYVSLGDSDKVEVRDAVLAVGNPLGMGINVTEGKISQIVRDDNGRRTSLRHTATIAPGNSGGSLYMGMQVVGVNVRGTPPYEFYEAVPINRVKPLLTEQYNKMIPLESAFPTNLEAILKKAKQVDAKNGEVPAATGNDPGVVSIPADFYPLEDIMVLLQAQKGQDLALIVTDAQNKPIGYGDARGIEIEAVLLPNDVNFKKVNINVLNYAQIPVKFGVSVNTLTW